MSLCFKDTIQPRRDIVQVTPKAVNMSLLAGCTVFSWELAFCNPHTVSSISHHTCPSGRTVFKAPHSLPATKYQLTEHFLTRRKKRKKESTQQVLFTEHRKQNSSASALMAVQCRLPAKTEKSFSPGTRKGIRNPK